jgi:hypothetical protein
MSFTQSISAGVQQAWISFLDTDNIAIGNATTAITAGQIRGSYPFIGIQEMPTGILEGEVQFRLSGPARICYELWSGGSLA